MGIEADADWQVNDRVGIFASLGLLRAVFDEYDNPDLGSYNPEGRQMAHAPKYQFSLGTDIQLATNWTLRAGMEGKDEFYYSNSHDSKSSSYVIYNASLQYQKENWKVTLWGRNLFDKDYYTRGFYFGIDPSKSYAEETYTQYGDPRVVGLTLSYDY